MTRQLAEQVHSMYLCHGVFYIFQGGTLVTRAYIKESTYRWNLPFSMPENISICLNRGREESVGNNDVSIVRARKYEMVRMT